MDPSNQPRTVTGAELHGARIEKADLTDSVFRDVDLSRAQLRGVYLWHAEIDGDIEGLRINGIQVEPLIQAELDRRHPERAVLRASTPEEWQSGWAGLEAMWAMTMDRVASLPPETVDRTVDDEWSFAQTLRHLVMATDAWFGMGIRHLPLADALHPLGMPFWEWTEEGRAAGLLVDETPPFDEVLAVRSEKVAAVRDYLATVTPEQLTEVNDGPPWASRPVTARDCIWIIANEEWQHHRFAVRDLDRLAAQDVA